MGNPSFLVYRSVNGRVVPLAAYPVESAEAALDEHAKRAAFFLGLDGDRAAVLRGSMLRSGVKARLFK